MEYKHEISLKNRLLDCEFDTWEEVHQFKREYDELKEVYAKAKSWEKLKDVIKDDYCDLSEEYNIEKLFHCKAIGKTMDLLEGSTDFHDFIQGE